jgi:hypothetical protein
MVEFLVEQSQQILISCLKVELLIFLRLLKHELALCLAGSEIVVDHSIPNVLLMSFDVLSIVSIESLHYYFYSFLDVIISVVLMLFFDHHHV